MKTKPYTHKDLKDDLFFKYPQWLWYDPEYKKLSHAAKSLYMYFLNMNSLSFRHADEYTDEQGEIYFICTRAEIRELMNCSYNQPRFYIDLLKRCGLIREKRMGCNRPNRLYLLRPETPYVKTRKPQKDTYKPHKHRIHTFKSPEYTLSNPSDKQISFTLQLDKDLPDLEISSVRQSVPDGRTDGQCASANDTSSVESVIKGNINYNEQRNCFRFDERLIDNFVEVMVDTVTASGDTVRIGKVDKPRSVVVGLFMRIGFREFYHCIERFKEVSEYVKNKPAYMRTMLYNSKLEDEAHATNLYASGGDGQR